MAKTIMNEENILKAQIMSNMGMTPKSIAKLLGVSDTCIRSRLLKAIKDHNHALSHSTHYTRVLYQDIAKQQPPKLMALLSSLSKG